MGFYPDTVRQIMRSARSCRLIPDAGGSGTAASFECGCAVTFAISVDPVHAVVTGLSFTSNGCGYMIAAAELLASFLHETRLEDLRGLETGTLEDRIAAAIEALPPERVQCVSIAVAAVRSAFADHRQRCVEEFRGESALVCTCFGVTEDTIEQLILEGRAITLEQVMGLTRAGSGCGSCRMLIEEIIDRDLS